MSLTRNLLLFPTPTSNSIYTPVHNDFALHILHKHFQMRFVSGLFNHLKNYVISKQIVCTDKILAAHEHSSPLI